MNEKKQTLNIPQKRPPYMYKVPKNVLTFI